MTSSFVAINWNPLHYMRVAVKFLLEHGAAGLFLDPGLGKTSIAYAAFKILLDEELVTRMLVITPLRPAYLTWPLEAKKWKQFSGLRVVVLHGKDKDKVKFTKNEADVYVINPEGLSWLLSKHGVVSSGFFDVLCVDESSKFKNTQTQRFKLLRVVLGCFKRRWILTGSPSPNGLMDLFGQIFLLDLGRALGRYITHYRLSYFYPSGYGGYDWKPQVGAEEKIYNALGPLVLRMSEKDYLDLPPITITDIPVTLPEKAWRTYKQMEDLLFVALDEGNVNAVNKAVALMKCRQIANGGLYIDEETEEEIKSTKRQHSEIHDAKTQAVVDLVEELSGKPVLIAYEFTHDLERLQKALPKAVVAAHATTKERLVELERAWNAGEIGQMLVQPQSVAHGLNLQAGGRAVIFHSLTYNYEDYDQLIRRVYRQGQKKKVFIYRIIAQKTVDEAIIGALRYKERGQQALFSALKEYRKKYGYR